MNQGLWFGKGCLPWLGHNHSWNIWTGWYGLGKTKGSVIQLSPT